MKKRFSWLCAAFLSAALLVPSFAIAEPFSIRNGLTFGMTAEEIQEKEPDTMVIGDSATLFTAIDDRTAVFLIQFNQDAEQGGVSTAYGYFIYSKNDDEDESQKSNAEIRDALIKKYGQVSMFADFSEEKREHVLNVLSRNEYKEKPDYAKFLDNLEAWETDDACILLLEQPDISEMVIYYVTLDGYDTASDSDLSSVL